MAFSHLLWLKLELTLLFKEDMIIMMLYMEALQMCFFSEMALFHVDQSHVIRISVKGPDSPRPDFFIPNEKILQPLKNVPDENILQPLENIPDENILQPLSALQRGLEEMPAAMVCFR